MCKRGHRQPAASAASLFQTEPIYASSLDTPSSRNGNYQRNRNCTEAVSARASPPSALTGRPEGSQGGWAPPYMGQGQPGGAARVAGAAKGGWGSQERGAQLGGEPQRASGVGCGAPSEGPTEAPGGTPWATAGWLERPWVYKDRTFSGLRSLILFFACAV